VGTNAGKVTAANGAGRTVTRGSNQCVTTGHNGEGYKATRFCGGVMNGKPTKNGKVLNCRKGWEPMGQGMCVWVCRRHNVQGNKGIVKGNVKNAV